VVLKWLSLKAGSNSPNNVEAVRKLTKHPAFNIKNPNNCYSLYMAFCRSHPNFHAEDGSGYQFLADSIIEVGPPPLPPPSPTSTPRKGRGAGSWSTPSKSPLLLNPPTPSVLYFNPCQCLSC